MAHEKQTDLAMVISPRGKTPAKVDPSESGEVVHFTWYDLDVSENRGTPKWMVYNGKPY